MKTIAYTVSVAIAIAIAGCSDSSKAPDGGADLTKPDGASDAAGLETGADSAIETPPAATCPAGSRSGATGNTDGETTAKGLKFNVRAPASYSPETGHPLIVVYSGAGGTAPLMESITRLTAPALKAGYIIAFADHKPPNAGSAVDDLATIPSQVAKKWCVDETRVYLTGHSDGGSVIYVGLFRGAFNALLPAAIAPSAAGLNARALAMAPCLTPPIPVMVLHSKNDGLFPGFGVEARDWWIKCHSCNTSGEPPVKGCVAYAGCENGADVRHCETTISHGAWPDRNEAMLDFFAAHQR